MAFLEAENRCIREVDGAKDKEIALSKSRIHIVQIMEARLDVPACHGHSRASAILAYSDAPSGQKADPNINININNL